MAETDFTAVEIERKYLEDKLNVYSNNSDYLQKARKYGHFTGYKN